MNRPKPWRRIVVYPLVALALTAGTCDVTRGDPTTTADQATGFVPTTTIAPPSTTVTTVAVTAPPESDRTGELEAIGAALNVNRLASIYNLDLEAARAVDGTDTIFDRDRLLINNGGWDFLEEPDLDNIPYEVTEVLLDRTDCAVVETFIDLRQVLGFDDPEEQIEVIFFDADGMASWGGILPVGSAASSWENVCDNVERTAVSADG